jgi:septum formation protein
VLRQAGVDPLVVVSGVDEDAIIAGLGRDAAPADVVGTLARAKAEQVVAGLDGTLAADCLVIGCDSMLEVDARLVGKPRSVAQARGLWRSMAGRSGRLHTGHCLLRLQEGAVTQREVESATTTVYFANPAAVELDAYIDSGEPLHVAGGFTIDGLGGWFVEGIEGDPSNVIGLSLPLLRRLLDRAGLSVAALSTANPVAARAG